MTRLGKLLHLSGEDCRLLLAASLLQAGIGLGLMVLPYRKVRSLADRLAGMGSRRLSVRPASVDRIALAVTRSARSVPGATCLTQALAARVLLERRGHPARVRVGITRTENADLLAHAWVESGGRVVLGGADLGRYASLAVLEGETH
jgi:Transglutaminase-like superfamily